MKKKTKKGKRADKPLDGTRVKRYTCIVCPACCELETDGCEVNGARCPKGESFALQETVMPLRVITTTVRAGTPQGGGMVPVKTTAPVPLSRVFEIMKQIKELHLSEVPAMGARLTTGSAEEPVEWLVTGELE